MYSKKIIKKESLPTQTTTLGDIDLYCPNLEYKFQTVIFNVSKFFPPIPN